MSKTKKFCKITRYIEQIDGELSQMISDLCLDRLFIPRGINGITFLYPKEKSYRRDIINSAYSDNPEKAIQMLESLIILDYLPRPGDFVLKKDDIPNSLRQKIEVTSADSSSVKLTCGSILKLDPRFAPIGRGENVAVYHLTGNQIPLNGEKASMKYASKRRGQKSTGSRITSRGSGSLIHAKTMQIAETELREKGYTDVFTRRAYSFCQSLMAEPGSRYKFWQLFGDSCITESGSATYMNALDPLTRGGSGAPDVHFQKWIEKFGQIDLDPLTEDANVQKSWHEFYMKARASAAKHKPFQEMDKLRLRLQEKLLQEDNPIKQDKMMLGLYSQLRPNAKTEELVSLMSKHERNFLDAFFRAESAGEDPSGVADNFRSLMGFYERSHNITKASELQLTKIRGGGMFDPAGKRTKQIYKVSDMVFGSPRTSDGPGDTSLINLINPAERDSTSLVNATVAIRDLQTGSGRRTLGGIDDLVQMVRKGGFFTEGVSGSSVP